MIYNFALFAQTSGHHAQALMWWYITLHSSLSTIHFHWTCLTKTYIPDKNHIWQGFLYLHHHWMSPGGLHNSRIGGTPPETKPIFLNLSINQSINLSIHQSTNQSVIQPANQSHIHTPIHIYIIHTYIHISYMHPYIRMNIPTHVHIYKYIFGRNA